jgi:hypothetical protein
VLATVNLNYVQSPDCSSLQIIGDRGWATWDGIAGTIAVGRLAGLGEPEVPPPNLASPYDAFGLIWFRTVYFD